MYNSFMKIKHHAIRLILPAILIFGLILPLAAQNSQSDKKISLAVLPFENMNKDPRQEYLSGLIGSIVRQDLSDSGAVILVDRNNLNEVLEEQKLQFTGVMDDESIIETGRLVGAEYILKGGYVFLGEDLFLNLDLISTETGRSFSFSERGYRENIVHAITEKLLSHLTGREYTLQSDGGERSIIAKSQQEPGRVLLFSHIIDARIYVDGDFIGYTTGDATIPYEIVLSAGRHSIRTHLTQNFGVVKTPEIIFSDWSHEFTLKPGQTLVLEDRTNHFNSILYDMQQVIRERIEIKPGSNEPAEASHEASFTDRQGKVYEITLDITFLESPEGEGLAKIRL
ncbi:MAG: CsgG/HfaB family protein, partial [Spirochaetales bacterium]|nr:CsgG/HfaB family protein [Spirochaetales bacterium]